MHILSVTTMMHFNGILILFTINFLNSEECEFKKSQVQCPTVQDALSLWQIIINSRITSLIISETTITDHELITLNEATFQQNPHLITLEIGANQVRSIQVDAFNSKFPALKKLVITNKDLMVLKSRAFFNLTTNGQKLSEFNLEENNIGAIESDAFLNVNCTLLILRSNRLKFITGNHFPSTVTSLDLSGNELSYIQENSLPSSLRIIYLINNSISSFDQLSGLEGLPHLRTLNLAFNNISKLALPSLPALVHLHLRGNRIDDIKEDTFRNSKLLQTINLNNNLIKVFPIKENLKSLKILYIRQNRLQFLQLDKISTPNLRSINTFGNPFNCKCLKELNVFTNENKIEQRQCRSRDIIRLSAIPVCISIEASCSYEYNASATTTTSYECYINLHKNITCDSI